MRVVTSDPPPPEFEALLAHRRRIGIDRRDVNWDGVLHMNPAPHRRHARLVADLLWLLRPLAQDVGLAALADFNIGTADNFRIPDCALVRPGPDELWNPTAALVIEVASPGDESWDKLGFYAVHAVDELLIVALEDG
jgi:Uma2 family endonuclease